MEQVVNVLYYDDFYDKGGVTQTEICQRTFHSKQTVNLIIRNLLNEAYVTVEEQKENKREKLVRITEAGKAYCEELSESKAVADKFYADRYLNMPRPYPITLRQKMYSCAMPKQYTMLKEAPYVIIPLFKSKELNGEYVSKLNPFATIWCVIENIFLAATAEGLSCSMRIPLNKEHDIVKKKLKVPPTYMIPVFIGIGYANPEETQLEQYKPDIDKQIRFGRWK